MEQHKFGPSYVGMLSPGKPGEVAMCTWIAGTADDFAFLSVCGIY